MTNEHAYELGKIFIDIGKLPAGDLIDRGLQLRRLLEENGYLLFKIDSKDEKVS